MAGRMVLRNGTSSSGVSFIVYADVSRPVALADLLARAQAVEAILVAVDNVPAFVVLEAPARPTGPIALTGSPVAPEKLAAVSLGRPGCFDLIAEVCDTTGQDLVTILAAGDSDNQLVCIADTTARAVLAAYALALAAAADGEGRLVNDNDLGLAEAAGVLDGDPGAFISATRLAPADRSLDDAVAAYFQQFPHLEHRLWDG